MPTSVTHTFLGMPALVESKPMRDLLSLAERVARSNVAVLITGETGSGKELVARAIHHYSPRNSKPWVDVNCAALPEHLVESELFGYERGAFSGAATTKAGLFELANTGTLFLDEIGELDPRMQVKLLRVLDGTPYYRLGGVRKINVDVRIVSATNLNLEEAVRTGRFRSDLYHRLSQMHLKVPPLRERPDDVAALACHFLRQQDSRYSFAPEAIDALRRKYWAGNVRELRNLVSKSVIFADGFCIGPEHLAVAAETPEPPDFAGSMVSLERIEKQTIFKALEQSSGHHQRAAELLGISRRTLSRRLKIYGTGETQETSVV